MRITALAAAAAATLTVALLAGCVPETSPSPSTISTPTDEPTATVTPSPTPTAGTAAQPVSVACTALVSLQQMYDFNPNYSLQASYAPKAGTAAYAAKADNGTACNWLNDTSSETVTISVARPGSIEIATLRTSAASGTPVSGLGDSAFFTGNALTVFRGDYWLVLQSNFFSSGTDASGLAKDALTALK